MRILFVISRFADLGTMGQLGFFDADKRLAAISAKGDPLEMIDRVVPFESFRAEIEAAVLTPADECEAAFISARAAVTRYRKRSRKQTARRARFGLVSSTCSVLSKPRREVGLSGPSVSCGRRPRSVCKTSPTTSADL